MRRTSRNAIVAAVLACLAHGAAAAPAVACRQAALAELRAASPEGYAIYHQTRDPGFFESWIDCGDAQYGLPTAVHEATHFVTGESDAFPLVGGGTVARPHEVSTFFPPFRIADRLGTDDFTAIYLRRGRASSATDFLYLLDEFNAYTHDLAAAVDLKALGSPDEAVDHRDGLAAMMAFLAVYAQTAQANEPETWYGLRQPGVAATIAALWSRAERVMNASCGIPNFGSADKAYLRQACAAAGPGSALGLILERAPICPAACLEPTADPADRTGSDASPDGPKVASEAVEVENDEHTASIRPRHPFGGIAGPRRHPLASRDD